MEYLHDDAKAKELKDAVVGAIGNSTLDVPGIAGSPSSANSGYKHEISSQYAVAAIDMYAKCLQYSANVSVPVDATTLDATNSNHQNNNISLQALPRFLTLWLTFTTPTEDTVGKIKAQYADNAQTRWMDKMNQRIIKFKSSIPVSIWYKGKEFVF